MGSAGALLLSSALARLSAEAFCRIIGFYLLLRIITTFVSIAVWPHLLKRHGRYSTGNLNQDYVSSLFPIKTLGCPTICPSMISALGASADAGSSILRANTV